MGDNQVRKGIIVFCVLAIALSSCQELLEIESNLLHNSPESKTSNSEARSNVRTILFSGYDWLVKSESFPVGPGPNLFSDSSDNVWVDNKGRLHMQITEERDRKWFCAEVISKKSFGYGTYRFYLDSSVDSLDPNVVLGLFTWSDDPAYNHREIDIECTRWGNANDITNAQFVVQPFYPNRLLRFTIPNVNSSTQSFTWSKGSVTFHSLIGHCANQRNPIFLLKQWKCIQNIPPGGDAHTRINLWLLDGTPPMDGKETEVIIRSFDFLPTQ
jgi:hypothetical protein